jgi:hypothetical protein
MIPEAAQRFKFGEGKAGTDTLGSICSASAVWYKTQLSSPARGDQGSMSFKPAQCPSCGGSLQVPDDHATVKCLYCGGAVIVREAIQAAAAASVPNLLKLARVAMESSNYQEGYDYYSRVLELDGDNSGAWAGKAEAAGSLSRLLEMVACFRNAIEVEKSESRDAVEEKAGAMISQVTTQNFYDMQARLSPLFANDEAWSRYLSSVGEMLKALEKAHQSIPHSAHILQAIIYLCDNNPEKLAYVQQPSGRKYWRILSSDWNEAFKEKKRMYSERLYELDPSMRPAEAVSRRSEVLTRNQWALFLLGMVVVVIFIAAVAANHESSPATTSQTNPTGKFPGTSEEKAYLEASGRYLNVHFEKCKSASVTMAGASDGSSTLSDIRTALLESRSRINESWETDFMPVSNGAVPQKFTDIDKKLRRVHELQEDAFLELLKYWRDDRVSHITTGSTMFRQALIECDSAIKDLSKILDSY